MVTDKKIHVAILDDHQSIIDGYLFRLGQSPDIEVVATARYTDELEALLAHTPVDVLLLDVQVPISAENPNPFPILERIPAWLQAYPELAVLVISMYNLPSLLRSVMEAGASGYLLKDDSTAIQQLPAVIRSVYGGGIFLSQQAHQKLLKRQPDWPDLTPRQIEVLSLCAAYPDATSADLAQRLGLANSTLRNLLSGAYLRLGVRNRSAAIAKAQKMGLITPFLSNGH